MWVVALAERFELIAHGLPHERPTCFQLVGQLDPCGHHQMSAASPLLGAGLVGAAEVT